MRPVRWLLVTGEPSGDRLAARVIRAAHTAGLPWSFEGMVGPDARTAGARVRYPAPTGTMGLLDVVPDAVRLWSLARRVESEHARWDGALLVDFHGFTVPLGRALRSRGLPVVLLSAPQVWAWRPSRAAQLDDCASAVGCLLDMEPPLLRALGVRRAITRFVGHPAAEEVLPSRTHPVRTLVVLPGSRAAEVSRLHPTLYAASEALTASGRVDAHVTAVPLERAGDSVLRGLRLSVGPHAAREELSTATAAVACSGTVTLECALAAVPTVVAYRTDPLTAAVARRLLRTPWIALPNVLLGRMAIPELVQSAVTVPRVIDAVTRVLSSEHRATAHADAQHLRGRLRASAGFGPCVLALLADTLARERPARGA